MPNDFDNKLDRPAQQHQLTHEQNLLHKHSHNSSHKPSHNLTHRSILYIVATPIGNLDDITLRAIEILKTVDLILVEDTRHSGQLLSKLGIKKAMFALHEHNEREKAESIIQRILAGETMALISDAGTPLISDPGFNLVRLAQDQGVRVVPIPGPSALIAALSSSGLPTDRFLFQGFLPPKKGERQKILNALKPESCTIIFYEAPHRLIDTFQDLLDIFGPSREAVLARELTKTFETIRRAPLNLLLEWIKETQQTKGECVILVAGRKDKEISLESPEATEAMEILKILLSELSVKQAAHLTAKITGRPKRALYQEALKMKNE